MSLWFEAVTANVKVIAGETVVGECLVDSVACVFTHNTLPNSIPIFREHYACACVKRTMVMHQGVLWRRNLIFPFLEVQIQNDTIAKISVTSPIVIYMPTRELLAGETKNYFVVTF